MSAIFRPSKTKPARGKVAEGETRLIFREFAESLNLIEDFDQIALNFLGTVREAVPVEVLAFFIYDNDLTQFRVSAATGIDEARLKALAFSPQDHLAKWLKINKTYLQVRSQPGVFDFLGERERDIFRTFGFELCYPLLSMNRLIGILCVGPKTPPGDFSRPEMAFIGSLTPQAGIALENAMLYKEQRERFRRMIRADRLATIGELAAGAAHEIRNPLTAIKSSLQYLESRFQEEKEKKLLAIALQETDRIDEILAALLSFSRPSDIKKEQVDLGVTLEESLALISFQARSAGVEVETKFPAGPVFLNGDKSQVKQLFLNIFLNAIQAMEGGGKLVCEILPLANGKILTRIIDTGEGIPEENMDKIYDPFFTTKKGGTGLGLSICYSVVKSHQGEIEVRSRVGEGTTVLVTLPAA
ncbi:MAG: ATP-binding protein [Candidatus Aminicenantales bacterium]|jgi:signal transduction histidine kinase